MSYILEALKKSEQERTQGGVPSVQTKHTIYPGMMTGKKKRFSFPVKSILTLVCISLSFCGWVYRDDIPFTVQLKKNKMAKSSPLNHSIGEKPPFTEIKTEHIVQSLTQEAIVKPKERATKTTPALEGTMEKERQPPVEVVLQPSPIILHQQPPAPKARKSGAEPPHKIAQEKSTLPTLKQLPRSIQKEIPTIQFAGHTYSAKPSLRMIMINNLIMKEGDQVSSGLRLEEITTDGIILNYNGSRFSIKTTR